MTSRYNFIPIFSFGKIKERTIKKTKTKQYTRTIKWTTLAYWSMNHKNITVNLFAFGWCYRMKKGYALYRKLINTMTHETLHGIIQKVMEQDKFSGQFMSEWPMKNGMDSDYARVMKRLNGL